MGVGVRVSVKIHTVYNKLLQTVNKRCVSVLVVVVVLLVRVNVVRRRECAGATLSAVKGPVVSTGLVRWQ